MAKGSCLCGDVKFEYQGEPAAKIIRKVPLADRSKAACHCLPCRKTSGTTNSYNLMIPTDKYKILSGSLRTFTRKGDSGKDVTYNYCQNCPTVLFVQVEAMPGINIVKMGTLDDEDAYEGLGKPGMEIYTKNRPSWCEPIPGAEQKETS
ncbi:hypothetical protein E4T43_00738 [Aureobasidium subglaciale]|nr:hypothetical protein E4T43_00738 [Aureobasidium subglaciale]